MDKSPDAFRTISEVAESLALPQHVLRFWESRFPQIKPLKRGGGRRYYRPDDVELLRAVKHLLYDEGYTIKGVQRLLKEQGPRGLTMRPAPGEREVKIDAAAVVRTAPSKAEDERERPTLPITVEGGSISKAEIDALAAALADLAECERILSHARAR
jgi:DNA-binding transcriptional MerR regulator